MAIASFGVWGCDMGHWGWVMGYGVWGVQPFRVVFPKHAYANLRVAFQLYMKATRRVASAGLGKVTHREEGGYPNNTSKNRVY